LLLAAFIDGFRTAYEERGFARTFLRLLARKAAHASRGRAECAEVARWLVTCGGACCRPRRRSGGNAGPALDVRDVSLGAPEIVRRLKTWKAKKENAAKASMTWDELRGALCGQLKDYHAVTDAEVSSVFRLAGAAAIADARRSGSGRAKQRRPALADHGDGEDAEDDDDDENEPLTEKDEDESEEGGSETDGRGELDGDEDAAGYAQARAQAAERASEAARRKRRLEASRPLRLTPSETGVVGLDDVLTLVDRALQMREEHGALVELVSAAADDLVRVQTEAFALVQRAGGDASASSGPASGPRTV